MRHLDMGQDANKNVAIVETLVHVTLSLDIVMTDVSKGSNHHFVKKVSIITKIVFLKIFLSIFLLI
jgi:hypothetical protein